MTDIRFRDGNDKAHFFGSSALTILFFAILLYDTSLSGLESFFLAFLASFICGLLMEIVTQFTPADNSPFWQKLPNIARLMFSHSPWDHRDVELNALGALVFYPVVMAIGGALAHRAAQKIKTAEQPAGITCVTCERKKTEGDTRKWFTLTHGKHVFYACPRCFPIYSSEEEKIRRLQAILEKINSIVP